MSNRAQALPARAARQQSFYRLRLASLLAQLLREKPSFWFLNLYLFFEYVRPQSLYPVIDVLPFGTLALGGVMLSFVAEGRPLRFRSAADGILLAFFGIAVASSIFAYYPAVSYENMYVLVSWVIVYFLITNVVVSERQLLIFTIAFLLYSFKMSQHGTRSWASIGFQFRDWGTYGAPGWFQNSGEFGIQMCIFFPIAAYLWLGLRKYWPVWKSVLIFLLPLTAVTGMVASSSRGALLGGGVVGIWMLFKSKYKVRGLVTLAILGSLLYAIIPTQQRDRIESSGSDATSIQRIEMWKDGIQIAADHPILGIGYFNWIPYRAAAGERSLLSHNIFVQCVSELGFTGLGALLALIWAAFWMTYKARKRIESPQTGSPFLWYLSLGLDGALVGFLTSGFFVTVLYYPFLWIHLAFCASLYSIVMAPDRQGRRRRISPTRTQPSAPIATPQLERGVGLR